MLELRFATVASWAEIVSDEPAFAQEVRRRFEKNRHKVLATVRGDGAPRVSGIEAEFRDGEVWLGMMPGSRKALDLRRDPRLALHSGTEDPPEDPSPGTVFDAKLSGRGVEVDPAAADDGAPHRFRIDVEEAVLVTLGDPPDHLLIKIWKEGRGLTEVRRA